MSTLVQRSFSGGEIAPSLYARVDTAKYATGLRTCRNMIVMRHGGAQNRPGTKFVCEVKDSTDVVRLIPFEFNSDQTYILEFGELYMRVMKDGVQQRLSSQAITGVTAANPGVVTYSGADTYSNGDEVFIEAVVGMTELNNRNFKIANVNTGANTFELQDMTATNFDTSALTTYVSGGTAAEVYELVTPYAAADLADVTFAQSADVITIAHPTYAPRDLSRLGDTSWTIAEISFEPEIARPTGLTTGGGGTGTFYTSYIVTAVQESTFEESIPGIGDNSGSTITGITQANPAVITTSAAHGINQFDRVIFSGIVGMTELNDRAFYVNAVTSTTITLYEEDSSGYTAWSSGGTADEYGSTSRLHATITVSNHQSLSWTAVDGAREYNIYKTEETTGLSTASGLYGYVGSSVTNHFRDIGVDPDFSDTPTEPNNPFGATDDYPSTVAYSQQRRFFGNTNNDTEKVWGSKTGKFKNFTYRAPVQSDDSFSFILAGAQVNSVKHLVDLGKMMVLTQAGEWSIEGDAGGTVTPTGVNPKQYGRSGSGSLAPLIVGGNALYVQARGSIVRDLSFDYTVEGYRGNDLTIFSAHLFDNYTIADWAFQEIPHSVVWVVRSDGVLLGLTYVREHQMWAWHRHDFEGGLVKNVASVAESNENVLYAVVSRTINGRTTQYIEKFATRQVVDIEDSILMDSSDTYDGTNTAATTMTLSGGTTWEYDETLTLTSSVAYFSSGDTASEIHMTGSDGTLIRFSIDAYTSTTVVTGRPHMTVPAAMQSVATAVWGKAKTVVGGLWHLEGEDVSIFADGFVVASPNNDSYDTITVSGGDAILDKAYVVIHVGLPYISDIETLDIDTPQGETLADKSKLVGKVSVFVDDSRGIWSGAKPPADDTVDPLSGLVELKIRDDEDYDSPVALQSGVVEINISPEWNKNGRVFIRQVDPVPLAVLAIAPAGYYPFRGG